MSLIGQLKYNCPEIIFLCDPRLLLLCTILPICLPNQTVNSLTERIKFLSSFIRSTNERQTLFQGLQCRAVQNRQDSHPQVSRGHPHPFAPCTVEGERNVTVNKEKYPCPCELTVLCT